MEKMICGDKGEEEDGEIHVEKGVLLMTKATIKDGEKREQNEDEKQEVQ